MAAHCNFTYSLLGIETKGGIFEGQGKSIIAISLTPY